MDSTTCKNCAHAFDGKFCNNCGQAAETKRINSKYLLQELQKTFIHFYGGFLYTTKQLFLNPGKALVAFIGGARVHYLRPLSYLTVISAVYLILVSFFHVAFIKEGLIGHTQSETDTFVKQHFVHIQLVLIFLYALFSLVFFQFRHLNFYEFVVIHCYLAGQRIIIALLFMPFHIWPKTVGLEPYLNELTVLIGYGFMVWAYVVLFAHNNRFIIVLKTILMEAAVFGLLLYLISLLV
jgi:hypothetical protein